MLSNSGDGLSILSEAQQLIARRKKQRYEPEPPLTQADLEMGTVIEDFVNVDDLAAAFMASGQDLFNFVLTFKYESEQTLEQKVEYYTEIILNHFDQLTFSNEWNEWGDISYPIVYPKNRI